MQPLVFKGSGKLSLSLLDPKLLINVQTYMGVSINGGTKLWLAY